MKHFRFAFTILTAAVLFVGCEDFFGDESESQLIIDPVAPIEQVVGSTSLSAKGLTFATKGPWTSTIQDVFTKASSAPIAEWIRITPDHGDAAGEYTIDIILEENTTGEDRKARIVITCGDDEITFIITQVATEDVPSDGGEDNSKPQMKCVSSIDYRYTNRVYEYDSKHYTLTYRYDDQNRVVRIEEINDDEDESYNSYEIWHNLDYTIVDNVTVTSTYKSGGDDSTKDETYDVTVQNGKAVEALLKGEHDGYETYKHTFSYDNAGYLVRMVDYSEEYGQEGVNIAYTNGCLTEVTWDEYEEEDDDSMVYDSNTYYPHKYPNNRTNVDFNMFLINGEPKLEGDIVSLLVSLRMCGKFGDACVEIGGGGIEEYFNSKIQYVNDPNYVEHVSYSSEKINGGVWNTVYEFDADGCPVKISYDVVYDVFNIEYDKVADTSKSYPYNPMYGEKPHPGEEGGDGVWYMVTTKNYKETKTGEIKCPAIYTITYKE